MKNSLKMNDSLSSFEMIGSSELSIISGGESDSHYYYRKGKAFGKRVRGAIEFAILFAALK
jgi:hypothetical protein